MTITARDLRNRQFGSSLRGYDPNEVRDFMEEVAQEMERMSRSKIELTERLAAANDSLSSVKTRESQIQGLLETAERTAKDRIKTVQSRGKALLAEAEAEAAAIVMRAKADKEQILSDVTELKAQRERFRAELKSMLRTHAEVLVRTGGSDNDLNDLNDLAPILESGASVEIALGKGPRRRKSDASHVAAHPANGAAAA